MTASACSRGSFEEQVAAAEAHLGAGDSRAALGDYQAISERFKGDPRRAVILLRIADLYSGVLDDPTAAIKSYGEAIKDRPLSQAAQAAHERRAAIREQRGDYEGAIEDYSALIKYFGAGVDAFRYRVLLAGIYISARNYRQARVEIKPLVEDKSIPADVREEALFIAAESFFLEGNTQRAAEYYQWFLNDFPKSQLTAEVKLHLATCLEDMGYLGMARDLTRSAGGQYPNKKVVSARIKSIDERGGGQGKGTGQSKAAPSKPAKPAKPR
ncbi:MAG: tetratricopeptide repeat protein [bacterium]